MRLTTTTSNSFSAMMRRSKSRARGRESSHAASTTKARRLYMHANVYVYGRASIKQRPGGSPQLAPKDLPLVRMYV